MPSMKYSTSGAYMKKNIMHVVPGKHFVDLHGPLHKIGGGKGERACWRISPKQVKKQFLLKGIYCEGSLP